MWCLKNLTASVFIITFFFLCSPVFAADWAQDAHDGQRTGYTHEEPTLPWTLLWTWNGADSTGGTGNHFYNAPREARTILGGNKLFVPAGAQGLYALDAQTGSQAWHITAASFIASPAYYSSSVYAGGTNGTLYKFNASNGQTQASYNAGNPIEKAVLIAGDAIFITTNNGELHKLNTNLQLQWKYQANSAVATPPAFSSSRNIIIYATEDLYIHAVNTSDGSRKWRVKPTPHAAGFPYSYNQSWPVVADTKGVVLLRMQLSHGAMDAAFPATMAEIKARLTNSPEQRNLFALNLDTGQEAFVTAVGYGSIESIRNGTPYGVLNTAPVVRTLSDGNQVAYSHFRSSQSNPPDYRWDAHMGEMVLDNSTISGLSAGDLRFVRMSRYNGYGGQSYVFITDEQAPISAAGNFLFHAHWGAAEGVKITDRSSSLGKTYAQPIATSNVPAIVRYQKACTNKNTTTHWTTCGLELYRDGRYWDGPGWWEYWDTYDNNGPQSAGQRALYTYVANGLVVVQGSWGNLMVFRHSGENSGPLPTSAIEPTQSPSSTPVQNSCPTDINQDKVTDISDYSLLVSDFFQTQPTQPRTDINQDGIVDITDYSLLVSQFFQTCQ